jgi:hypothetical protein
MLFMRGTRYAVAAGRTHMASETDGGTLDLAPLGLGIGLFP